MEGGFLALSFSLSLFIGILLCLEWGRRTGFSHVARESEGAHKGIDAIEAALYGLLGLLVAFTFASSVTRFEARRHLIAEEANAIGTAYLRIDTIPAKAQPEMRNLFQQYLESRIDSYSHTDDRERTLKAKENSAALQSKIWKAAVAASQMPDATPPATMLMLPALNQMIDITTTRHVATQNHPPMIIYLLLGGLGLVGAWLAGYRLSQSNNRKWLHVLLFAVMLSLTAYVILDIEYPRLGLIRIHEADQVLRDLLKSMR